MCKNGEEKLVTLNGVQEPLSKLDGEYQNRQLMSAIILRALADYWGSTESSTQPKLVLRSEAEGWLFHYPDKVIDERGVSLATCCEVVGIPIEKVRELARTGDKRLVKI